MCDFKVGDEVTLIKATSWKSPKKWMLWTRWRHGPGPAYGEVVTVTGIGLMPARRLPDPTHGDLVMLRFDGWGGAWFSSLRFRKVIRRDISAWLETSTDFEEPKRVPAGADA